VKRFVSLLLILTLGFVGASSVLHQLEQEETHSHENGTHLCTNDAHHHCLLCETILSYGFINSIELENFAVSRENDYAAVPLSRIFISRHSKTLGRAPPFV